MHSLSLTALGLPPCFRWEGRAGGAAPPPETPDTALPWPATRLGSVSWLFFAAFQTGGVLPCHAWVELGVKHIPCRQPGDSRDRQEPLLCAAPPDAPRPSPPEALLQPVGTRLPAASPMLSRPSRGEPGALLQSWPLLGAGAAPLGPNLCAL